MVREVYGVEMSFEELLDLLMMSTNLSIDSLGIYCRKKDKKRREDRQSIFFGYSMAVSSLNRDLHPLHPLIVIDRGKHMHKRQQLLDYSGSKLLGLGAFSVGRVADGDVFDVGESDLLGHIDLRSRRLTVSKETLGTGVRWVKKWYTPLTVIMGLHRWGLSWRRIIASALSLEVSRDPSAYIENDIRAVAASIVEYAYNRARYRVHGEERSMVSEALGFLEDIIGGMRRDIDNRRRVKDPVAAVSEVLDEYIDHVHCLLREEIYKLAEVVREITRDRWPKDLDRDSLRILDVYKRGLKGIYRLAREMVRGRYIVFLSPTETWSPIYLYPLTEYVRKHARKGYSLNIVLGFTPQTLPHVVFSLVTLYRIYGYKMNICEGILNLEKISFEPSSNADREHLYRVRIDLGNDRHVEIYPIPIIARNPSLTHRLLESIIETIDKHSKLLYTPEHCATTSMLYALYRLERSGRARSAI